MNFLRPGKFFFFSLFAFACFAVLFFVPKPERAYACPGTPPATVTNPVSVPTLDIGLIALTTQVSVQTGGNYTKECFLDYIGKALAEAVIHSITSSIIEWINNGFEGGPTFVTDPAGFFTDIADEELGRFIDGSALGFLCDPFKFDIQIAFLGQRSRYKNPSRCTITGIVKNLKGFTQGDFKEGGWSGWLSMSTIPQNNPYGSALLSEQLFVARASARQNTSRMTLDWGKGFKSILGRDGKIKTPGDLIDDQLKRAVGNDLEFLNLGREFDDIVMALVNVGISQIMGNGLR